jgi:hypothetical protein
MKNIFAAILIAISLLTTVAQDNPYQMFGTTVSVNYEVKRESLLRVNNSDTTSEVKMLAFDFGKQLVYFLGANNETIKTFTIDGEKLLRWLSVDPKAKDYAGMSPYNFVGNTPIRAVDPDGKDIYILFATTGNKRGDAMFSASANTRKDNIESSKSFDPSKDRVVVLQVADLSQIKNMVAQTVNDLSKQYGQTKEVGLWSHGAAEHGPSGGTTTSNDASGDGRQMSLEGWGDVDFNWKEGGASFTMYGCNTANNINKKDEWVGSYAKKLSELPSFDNVEVAGQSSSTYPSTSPVARITNFTRQLTPGLGFAIGETYMIGGNPKEGSNALSLSPSEAPRANLFNVYKEGKQIGAGMQSTTATSPINK